MLAAEQIVRFIVVGVITTVVDFAIFNLLTGRRQHWRRIPANFISVTAAMTWAFLANWFLVFQPAGDAWLDRAGRFLLTTAFSAFVLQNAVLYLTTYRWKTPVKSPDAVTLSSCSAKVACPNSLRPTAKLLKNICVMRRNKDLRSACSRFFQTRPSAPPCVNNMSSDWSLRRKP